MENVQQTISEAIGINTQKRYQFDQSGSLSENQFTQSARPHFAGESDTNLGHVARYAPQIRSVPPQTGDAHLGQSVFGQSPGGTDKRLFYEILYEHDQVSCFSGAKEELKIHAKK